MASYTISPIWGAGAQLFDNSGNVLTGGKIYTYLAGTTTPATTYTTPIGTVANSNPIVANSAGRLTNEIWFPVSGAYKFVLKDANDVLIATYDNIPTTPQPPIVNDASSVAYEPGYEVTAGGFTVGATYLITSVGTTDFVAIGAAANVTGIHFTATGVGSGTGKAEYTRYVQDKLRETVSVKDFGAVGDDATDNLPYFKAALQHLESIGGGALYIPSGIYRCSKPIIVRSNIEMFGDGSSSVIKNDNPAGYSPPGNCIHIGITNEWEDWEGTQWTGMVDATIAQWDSGDYSHITTENVYVHDLKLTTDQPVGTEGQGIWVANTQNFVVENIWTDTVATPVSVGNDYSLSYAGSRNGVVKNIFQLVAGRWYDLVYLGECELIDVSNCFNNPKSNATLNTAIAVGGNSRFCRVHNNVIRYQSAGGRIAIDISGPVVANQWFNIIENNTIVAAAVGITTYQKMNQIIKNNSFYGCDLGIRGYNTGQTFDGNVFYGNIADIFYKSGCTSVTTNSVLTPSKISGDSAGDVSQQKFRNCVGYGGYKAKIFWPIDYINGIGTETSNVNFHNSQITLVAPGTVGLWFRLPDNLLTATTLTTYWYANTAGEVLTQGLYKREAAINVNSLIQVGSTQTYTSSGAGDITSTWSSINATVTNQQTGQPDQYYVYLTVTFASTLSQLRSSQFIYTTVGTLD